MQIRVHELAKELKISAMSLKKQLQDLGVITKSHMSLIEDEVADKIRKTYHAQVVTKNRAEEDRKAMIEFYNQAPKVADYPFKVEEEASEEPAHSISEASSGMSKPATQKAIPDLKDPFDRNANKH
ncbi:MAG: translation initiation factor IF-2 N-terminal domain-containing protein [Gammaproteobacteria bacterium]|jgi:translation initiation factor IF-2